MALYRYGLVVEDGTEADPAVFYTADPEWQAGATIVAGGRSFEILDRREPSTATDTYAVLVVRPL